MKDKVNLELPIKPARRNSRAFSHLKSRENFFTIKRERNITMRLKKGAKFIDIDASKYESIYNIVSESSEKELQRVEEIAKRLKDMPIKDKRIENIQSNSRESGSQFSKLSSAPKPVPFTKEVNKITNQYTPPCGCASILIVDDQIINRLDVQL